MSAATARRWREGTLAALTLQSRGGGGGVRPAGVGWWCAADDGGGDGGGVRRGAGAIRCGGAGEAMVLWRGGCECVSAIPSGSFFGKLCARAFRHGEQTIQGDSNNDNSKVPRRAGRSRVITRSLEWGRSGEGAEGEKNVVFWRGLSASGEQNGFSRRRTVEFRPPGGERTTGSRAKRRRPRAHHSTPPHHSLTLTP